MTRRRKDPHNVALGRAVTTFRNANSLTREELAKRAKLSVEALQEIEAGKVEAKWGDLRHIAYGCGVQLSQLIVLGEKLADQAARKREEKTRGS